MPKGRLRRMLGETKIQNVSYINYVETEQTDGNKEVAKTCDRLFLVVSLLFVLFFCTVAEERGKTKLLITGSRRYKAGRKVKIKKRDLVW